MLEYQLWKTEFAERITVVCGDLTKERLGISLSQWNLLASTVDIIYHNGALVNFVHNYKIFKAPNVQSVISVLELASIGCGKYINFVSTAGIYMGIHKQNNLPWLEDDAIATSAVAKLAGYNQSKWVAEQILERARERGFHVAIFRPSRIIFNKEKLHYNQNDLLTLTLKFSIGHNILPDYDHVLVGNLVNVDTVSRAILVISLKRSSYGKNFNIYNPNNTPFAKFALPLRQLFPNIKTIDRESFMNAIKSEPEGRLGILIESIVFQQPVENHNEKDASENIKFPEITADNLYRQLGVEAASLFEIPEDKIKNFVKNLSQKL